MAINVRDNKDWKGNRDMALVKVRRGDQNQITLPDEVREALQVAEGDYLDVEVTESGVLLKPVAGADRQRALEQMFAAKARVRPTPEQAKKSPEEQEQEIFDEVKTMRREYAQGRPR